jgi:argininosuccinate synthase
MQQPVSGVVALELYKGSVRVKGTKSSHALYDSRLSGRSSQGVFSQKEARAYAKLHGLQDVIAYLMKRD